MDDNYKYMGLILVAFVGIVIALALLPTIANTVAGSSTVYTAVNKTVVAGTALNTPVQIGDWGGVTGTYIVLNATVGNTVPAANYTITNGIGSDGLRHVYYTITGINVGVGPSVNVSGQYLPSGYMDDSGSRAIASLIVIFFVLGIAMIAIYPSIKEKFGL